MQSTLHEGEAAQCCIGLEGGTFLRFWGQPGELNEKASRSRGACPPNVLPSWEQDRDKKQRWRNEVWDWSEGKVSIRS